MTNNSKTPKISIIIPVYNGEKYLKEAIDSALAQTYSNYEIIVINDGSTDETESIAKAYGDKIRYYKKQNGGVSSALNLGIKKMRGEYFSWLSHDDTYEPDKLQAEVDFLRKNNYLGKKIIVFSDCYLMDQNGKRFQEIKHDSKLLAQKPEYVLAKNCINGLTLLIPKRAFDDCGNFDTTLTCVQDYALWYKMSKKYRFLHTPHTLVSTRCHSKQTTNVSPNVLTEGNDFYINLIKNVPKNRRIALEGSEYCFLEALEDVHHITIYKETADFCVEQKQKLLDQAAKQTDKYKISIIIPFYNRIEQTQKAIQSVLNQTHQNFEIILINDGSSDDITEIQKLTKKHKNITLLNNKQNAGPSVARNKGIQKATGNFIAFLDSDDEFTPDKLSTTLKYALAADAKIIHTSCKDQKGNIFHTGQAHGSCAKSLVSDCILQTSTIMINRQWLNSQKHTFNPNLQVGEDVCMWLKLLKNDLYLVGIDKPLTIIKPDSSSLTFSLESKIEKFKNIISYVLQDSYYRQFDQNIAVLISTLVNLINQQQQETQSAAQDRLLESYNTISKLAFFLRKEGPKATLKRCASKFSH